MVKPPKRGVIEAAGGLVWRTGERGAELAVIFRPRRKDWSLPKGHKRNSETWQEAALREVWEETGCRPHLGDYAGCTTYLDGGFPKIVLFWNMVADDECPFEPNREVDRVAWLTVDEALEKLVYDNERDLVRGVVEKRAPASYATR